jgi:TolB protein
MATFSFLRRILRLVSIAIAASVLAAGPTLLPPVSLQASISAPHASSAAAALGVIAYVQRSTHAIHVISPDGAGDRVLWTAPQPLSPYPAYDLAWRPDGRELAFSSEHEEACSYYESDVYAIGYDGAGYRRVTNSPACAALASLPKGTVEVHVTNGAGPLAEVYVQGAPGAQFAENGTMRFDNVADFGPGIPQPAVGMYLGPRGEERAQGYPPYADVLPNQTVFGGSLTIPGNGALMFGSGKVSWNADGSMLAYGMRSYSGIKQISARPPYGSTGQPLPVVQRAVPNLVAWGPTAATSDLYLYSSKDDAIYLDVAGIYLNSVADPSGGTMLVPIDAYYGAEEVYDIEWLPDASGFLFSMRYINLGTFTNIFEYDFTTQEITQVTYLPDDEAARRFSVSPDGQSVVFEWVPEVWDPTSSLWIVNRDGSGLRKLADDAGRPAWGQVPPPPTPRAYLPLMLRRR